MAIHSELTGSELHESKGVDTAAANTVAVADGAGSTAWQSIGLNQLDTSEIVSVNTRFFTGVIDDVSTSGSKLLISIPANCTVTRIDYILAGAITTADASVVATNVGVGAMATTTIDFTGSAEGTQFSETTIASHTVSAGGYLKFASAGGSTGAQKLWVTVTVVLT